ncbi:MAG: hypothetical protein FWD42_06015 [Solirubrobacterales bacterium]|nr:hypothetical protein [Solirubrobacterales bacterium]
MPESLPISKLEEIRRTAEHRLKEIEPLIEEAYRLRNVLSVIEERDPTRRGASSHGHLARGLSPSGESSRARKGHNKRVILELAAERPGITPAQIADLSGVKRAVVASTVSRLKRTGELESHEGGVRVARAARSPA